MATTLGQTLVVTHDNHHFRLEVVFIRVTSRVVEFDLGDEIEVEVGPGVNAKVTVVHD